jgi:hypothetical protein
LEVQMNLIVPHKTLEPNIKVAREFWDRFGGADLQLLYLWPDGGAPKELRGPDALEQALELNQQGYNIYFTVNRVRPDIGKKPAKEDIIEIRAVYADIDWGYKKNKGNFLAGSKEVVDKCKLLIAMLQPPTFIIRTGGGIQPIWMLEPLPNTAENTELAEAVSDYIADQFGGDNIKNIDRMLRMPGTVNHGNSEKLEAGQPKIVASIIYDGGPTYKLDALTDAWGVTAKRKTKEYQPEPFNAEPMEVEPLTESAYAAEEDEFEAQERSNYELQLRAYEAEIALKAAGNLSAEDEARMRAYVGDYRADNRGIELVDGSGAYLLQNLRQVGMAIASVPDGPFSKREGWLDLLFACT